VEFRYGDPLDEALDREWTTQIVAEVRTWLDALLSTKGGSS
jgi:hypothetical protein